MSKPYSALIFFYSIYHFYALTLSARLPSIFQTCKIENNACLKSSMESAISNLGNGLRELDMVGIDPFKAIDVVIEPTPGPVSIYQKYSNSFFGGLKNTKIETLSINLDKCNINFTTYHPLLQFNSEYIIKGKFLIFTIDSKGKTNSSAANTRTSNTITCQKLSKNGKEYLKITNVECSITWGNVKLSFGDVVDRNDQINKEFSKLLNDDPSIFLETVQSPVEHSFETLIKESSRKLFEEVPLNEIFQI